jgi:hypothetical protein
VPWDELAELYEAQRVLVRLEGRHDQPVFFTPHSTVVVKNAVDLGG